MTPIQKRFALFLIGCIGTRLAFALVARVASQPILKALGYLALLPAIGFILIYALNLRKTGQEVMGEKIWWNHLRPLHAFIYFVFSYLAISGNKNAWLALLADVIIGFTAFTVHHYKANSFMHIF